MLKFPVLYKSMRYMDFLHIFQNHSSHNFHLDMNYQQKKHILFLFLFCCIYHLQKSRNNILTYQSVYFHQNILVIRKCNRFSDKYHFIQFENNFSHLQLIYMYDQKIFEILKTLYFNIASQNIMFFNIFHHLY